MSIVKETEVSEVGEVRGVRGFWALIVTQFQGAYSDNILRNLLLSMIVGMGLARAERETFVSIVTFLFSVPFLLFSMPGGWLADRFSKRDVTIWTKVMEIGSMAVATAGLALHSMTISLIALTLVATQAALFGPSKYGLLPELLPVKRLSWGNGVIELGTFLAIILGTVTGATMADWFHGREVWAGYSLLALSIAGLATSFGVSKVPVAAPTKRLNWNIAGDLWKQIGLMQRDRALFLAVAGNTYFWFLGGLLFSTIVVFGPDVLHLGQAKTGYLNAMLAVGIGVGSMVAGLLSGNKIEYGLIPMGSIGMTVTCAMLGFHGLAGGIWSVALLLTVLGFFAGFYAVPVNAMIQHLPAEKDKGGVIAAANLLSSAGVALSAGVYYVFTAYIHLDPREVMLAAAAMTAVGTVYVLMLLPEWFGRLILFLVTRTVYRVRVNGRENFPQKQGALLVCNHMSFVDAALLVASTDRPIRFLMYEGIFELPWIKPFAKMLRAIPISSEQRPRELIHALRTATEALKAGEIVCIFAEGQITHTGQLLPFRRGLERIMKGVDAPIVPVNLDGVWGSIFSFERGRFFWKMPQHIPYPVTVSFGKPMAPESTAVEVRAQVMELQAGAFERRKSEMKTLDRAFVQTARMHPGRFFMADAKFARVTFGAALAKTMFVAQRLRKVIGERRMIGVLLPPSVGGALTNYALMLMGRIAVNLNYTSSSEILARCAEQCETDVVITSRAFLERFPGLAIPGRTVLLEDVLAAPGWWEKLAALGVAWLVPAALLRRVLGAECEPGRAAKSERGASAMDELATVIFSSGSTGDPKGVMLSHFNLTANIQQVSQVFMLDGRDKILGILPFFHSFGYMGALWLPAVNGVGVVYHPNPLDAQGIGELVERYRVTFMIATPTFLQAYMRRCTPESFGSLEYVLVGAEKLPERVSIAFEDMFGIRPLEGYGCTECSPVVTVNGRDYRAPGYRQVAAKRGRIGHPLPGVSVKVVDLDSGLPVAAGETGMLLVKGPNVMQGYLGRPEKTAEVLRDGWYVTGDVARMEEDGFLAITDRLSRFSKIGGEMVPHIRIEDTLQELAGATEQVFAVTALPDEKKGERIAVLTTLKAEALAAVVERLAKSDLPALWRPKAQMFFCVEALPVLGSGKMDLRGARAMAATLVEAGELVAGVR